MSDSSINLSLFAPIKASISAVAFLGSLGLLRRDIPHSILLLRKCLFQQRDHLFHIHDFRKFLSFPCSYDHKY